MIRSGPASITETCASGSSRVTIDPSEKRTEPVAVAAAAGDSDAAVYAREPIAPHARPAQAATAAKLTLVRRAVARRRRRPRSIASPISVSFESHPGWMPRTTVSKSRSSLVIAQCLQDDPMDFCDATLHGCQRTTAVLRDLG
jgi:hypothetical protein